MKTIHNCEDELKKTDKYLSGFNKDGDARTCSCGKIWVYVEDEAEGGCWQEKVTKQ